VAVARRVAVGLRWGSTLAASAPTAVLPVPGRRLVDSLPLAGPKVLCAQGI
jgi:hypothetical protein